LKLRQIPPCRFDIVAVEGEDLHWFKAAFNA
jgi:Holliday junction resolvase-like predicted endonuclease